MHSPAQHSTTVPMLSLGRHSKLLLFSAFLFVTLANASHNGYKMVRLVKRDGHGEKNDSEIEKKVLDKLMHNEKLDVDVITVNVFIVAPNSHKAVVAVLDAHGIEHETQTIFQNEFQRSGTRSTGAKMRFKRDASSQQCVDSEDFASCSEPDLAITEDMIHGRTLCYPQIVSWLKMMQRKYPDLFKLEVYGTSYEGRCLYVARVNSRSNGKVVVMEGGTHAREWGAISSVLVFLQKLLKALSDNECEVLAEYEYLIIPSYNPDGYEFSRTKDRLWRKNLAHTADCECRGIDLNRNMAVAWAKCSKKKEEKSEEGTEGEEEEICIPAPEATTTLAMPATTEASSPDQANATSSTTKATQKTPVPVFCKDIYKGRNPISEPESKAFESLMEKVKGKVRTYFAVHTFGNMWLYPYSFTNLTLSPNHEKIVKAGWKAVEEIKKKYDLDFKYGAVENILGYAACGSTMDWMVDSIRAEYSYALELTNPWANGVNMEKIFVIEDWEVLVYGGVLYTGVLKVLEEAKNLD